MNIIMSGEDYMLRTTKLSQSEIYDLSELNFYIPNSFNQCNVFIALINSVGLTDIIPLNFIENSQSYKKYKVTYANSIRVDSGIVKIKIILVNSNNHSVIISCGDVTCNITIENYKIGHQVAITNELNTSMQNMYAKIQELTKMNIDIYEKMVEVSKT